MKVKHIGCGIFEVTDYDGTIVLFTGCIEDCERFIRRYNV